MTNQTPTNEQETTTTTETDLSTLEFADYEKVRRGETLESKEQSAPEAKEPARQKQASESGTEQTEEESEAKDESEEETESDEDSEESKDEAKEKPKKKGGFQRRIDKLNAAKAEAQREAEYWRKLALKEGAEAPKDQAKDKPAAKADDGKPSADDFDTHAEFVEALTDWKVDQKAQALEEKQRKAALETEQQKLQNDHLSRVKAFAEKTADFEEVISDVEDIPVSAALQELIVTSENGPELIYELAKNRADFERISKLRPLDAAREIGRIETRIAAKASAKPEAKPKQTTKAPNPPSPVGTGRATMPKSIADPDISFAEYERLRREEMKRRGA